MSQQHLINNDVFDRSGYLIGNVVRVEPSATDFSLIVQLIGRNGGNNQATIPSASITDIDSENKTIYVDRDQSEFSPNAGQKIQLVEERLVVNRKRVKVGEVSVRRVVETEIVEVPVRREKLVIEHIGSGNPPVEMSLGETQLQGHEIAVQPDSNRDITASGTFETIQGAMSFLSTAEQRPELHCEKIRVAILLDGENGLKGTIYEFETPQAAIQKLARLEKVLLNQLSHVRLELFLSDPTMVQTYQNLISECTSV
ncbi:YsnF/AvaK domain-containing protein [Nodosilinea sp. FACHB-13]|uniref:YsnF/AvaK domain-containing protein n=1 Tax=Cyanophyceae TaxID=3028117 RepID=UPI001681DAB3|nr:YsnF/AvaK domain-containing protein [Nodosilinea sp. FACHB-13]MBD2108588.1 YsnF/AvaK domain-containing protein [Nodosilinea sp. FACHB-13]